MKIIIKIIFKTKITIINLKIMNNKNKFKIKTYKMIKTKKNKIFNLKNSNLLVNKINKILSNKQI